MTVPTKKLIDENTVPQVGLGFWQVKDQAAFDTAFETAVKAGYRHFDTAQAYGNEQFLGEALKRSKLARKDVWITTKVKTETIALGNIEQSIAKSLERLQTEYVDLLLLHFPVTFRRKHAWKKLEEAKKAGQTKSIGVSNYTVKHLEEMKTYAEEMPSVNQVELHVFLQQPELVEYCKKNKIALEAYSPLAHAKQMDEPVIADIAKKYSKSYAQVMLRWCVEQDFIVLPKSVTPKRIKENIDIFDFEFDASDIKKLSSLNRDLRTCWDPTLVP